MKKIQLPAIGGIRKVIQPGATVAAGTTIAEIGANSISLAQLAQLITQIQAQQQNSGGGNIVGPATPGGGGSAGATITLGPGLAGGGVLAGNVPIRLTAPIPWGLDDGGGGGDGDPGPPGAAGAAGAAGLPGAQGPTGPAVFLDAEPGDDGLWAVPGPVGPTGPAGATGATGPQGPAGTGSGGGGAGTLMFWVPEENFPDDPIARMPSQLGPLILISTQSLSGNLVFDAAASRNITFNGNTPVIQATAVGAVLQLTGNATGAIQLGVANPQNLVVNSNGATAIQNAASGAQQLLVAPSAAGVPAIITQAGNSSGNFNTIWKSVTAVQIAALWGDGGLNIGPSTLADMTTGTINVSNGYFINGAPLSRVFGAGLATHLLGDGDNYNDDQGFFAPNPTSLGPMVFNGYVVVNPIASTVPLQVGGASSSGASPILAISGGTSSYLSVRDTTNSIEILAGTSATTGGFIGTLTNHEFDIRSNNITRISITNAGNMTLNTPTSGIGLSIGGAAASGASPLMAITGGTSSYLSVRDTTNSIEILVGTAGTTAGFIGTLTNHEFDIRSNNAVRVAITNAGNVTLNAPGSGQTLTITGTAAGTAALTVNTAATTGTKTAAMTATNKPGTNNQTTPSTWLPIICDGTTYYVPLYAA